MVKKYSEKYPAVDNLLCCYFNQDWDDYFDSPEAVVHDFVVKNSFNWVKQTATELNLLLKENHIREEWFRIISDDFGCCYALRSQDIEPTSWLKKVQKQLEDELALAEKKEEK